MSHCATSLDEFTVGGAVTVVGGEVTVVGGEVTVVGKAHDYRPARHRALWRMPMGPVVNLTRWMEAAGCLVFEEDFGTQRIDGLSQWVDDHPIILINANAAPDRKRLTKALSSAIWFCIPTGYRSDGRRGQSLRSRIPHARRRDPPRTTPT
ncbi:putative TRANSCRIPTIONAL REGULATORY domain protein [Mycobacterium xenopi 3993]|nr:putative TRANSCRIPTIONAL REGULATORY domain protein [Mycobacterium xenopi 3993]